MHWLSVVLLVRHAGLAPLAANPLGWFVALWVSWSGHHRLSFAGSGAAAAHTLPRFAAVSLAGFVANQAAYALLLHGTGLGYGVALAIVLALIALLTWLASRHWAFAGRPPPAPAAPAPDATDRRETSA